MSMISTVGLDMGDKDHVFCMLDHEGHVVERGSVVSTASSLQRFFSKLPACRVVLEAGTHSGWVSRLLDSLGHEVLVGNPRKLRVIWDSDEKSDHRDAEMLARIGRFDPQLLYPIHHRGEQAQKDLAVINARMMLVKLRTSLIAHVRGSVKTAGHRISTCNAECFHKRLTAEMPETLEPALSPLVTTIETMNATLADYDKKIKWMCQDTYPETQRLMEVSGVGPITALAFVLTLEDPKRYRTSRSVGAFIGLTPKRDQSGQTDKPLGITKAGNPYLRTLLVNCAQYILGAHGPDCDLRRAGMKIAAQGGKIAKRRAVIAVARRLAVLMHKLWRTGAAYDPFYQLNRKTQKAA